MDKSYTRFENTSPVYICPMCNTHGIYTENIHPKTKTFNFVATCLKCANKNKNKLCSCQYTYCTGEICKKHAAIFTVQIDFTIRGKYFICEPVSEDFDATNILKDLQLPNLIRLSKFIHGFSKTHKDFSKIGNFLANNKTNYNMGIPIEKFIINSIQEIIGNIIPKIVLIRHVLIGDNCLPLPELLNTILSSILGKELFDIIPYESIDTVYDSIIVNMKMAKLTL